MIQSEYAMKPNRDFLLDAAEMGAAGLRFAEQFEMNRVLAEFERELCKVAGEAAGAEAKGPNASPGE